MWRKEEEKQTLDAKGTAGERENKVANECELPKSQQNELALEESQFKDQRLSPEFTGKRMEDWARD
jgi:hypothetical protein